MGIIQAPPGRPPIICLLGPTASGKTALSLNLTKVIPCEIVSVDSVMVYRGLDIGTAKPEAEILQQIPHHLLNICDPSLAYSAGKFCHDAREAIAVICARGKIPLLVGGTMLYFRALQTGLADLPVADNAVRHWLYQRMQQEGLNKLHAELNQIDPLAAARISPSDSQRILRALEVYFISGKTISQWQANTFSNLTNYRMVNLVLLPQQRTNLHNKIKLRFDNMLQQGFLAEVERLFRRKDLTTKLPAIRAVGYKQIWDYLAGTITYSAMYQQALAATRQLAKRQISWLRTWPHAQYFASETPDLFDQVRMCLATSMSRFSEPI